ncbi:hypothetical protein VA596_37115 [Amycolatopsis sp., V23-08]|uniref:Tetracyclin repressor-like C-terminal domain-containing protein n=1 Tax=Amycolatopsis heterodermiae TaxID=3110235 RepID=A0ABU5RFZ8_9PSEU|nr:hypothetical protein [Amycolatopsis sp., V23-08]MEA5365201.1 hypothetical protein [Amycolatopsis sp., V23-08]
MRGAPCRWRSCGSASSGPSTPVHSGPAVHRRLPRAGRHGRASLVTAASAFVAKLFPLTRPSATLRELYDREPEIARVFPPFRPTLQHMIAATTAGLAAIH